MKRIHKLRVILPDQFVEVEASEETEKFFFKTMKEKPPKTVEIIGVKL